MKQSLSLGAEADARFDILETRGRDRKTIIAKMQDGRFEADYWDARLFGSTFLESRDAVEKDLERNCKEENGPSSKRRSAAERPTLALVCLFPQFTRGLKPGRTRRELRRARIVASLPQALKFVEHGSTRCRSE